MRFSSYIFLVLMLLFSSVVSAQIVQKESIAYAKANQLFLNVDEVFSVEIISGDFKNISYFTKSEGEYTHELLLEVNQLKEKIYINSIFDAKYASGFDKLSSHKVFAFQLKLFVPNHFKVFVKSNIANVNVTGRLAFLNADLKSGHCTLQEHEGNASINTYRGDIQISTQKAKVKATSRNGAIKVQPSQLENYTLNLKSIDGDIKVNQLD